MKGLVNYIMTNKRYITVAMTFDVENNERDRLLLDWISKHGTRSAFCKGKLFEALDRETSGMPCSLPTSSTNGNRCGITKII